ncbi:FxSxx-COOH system tetratricopeptide repeat protein [Streptomyces sp. NPDC052610]|uniref:FxSxx-COOH system tetratricopeptide repeat protein n=1 Tax=Streptomyces sp. NPDC052610 TaxID=3154952 RepID=UPI003414D00A
MAEASARHTALGPIAELAERLSVRTGAEPSARELAEALWLAGHVEGPRSAPDATGDEAPGPPSDDAAEPATDLPDPESPPVPPDPEPPRPPSAADDRTRLYADRSHTQAAGPGGGGPAFVRVRVPTATALPEPLRIQRALRPLQRYRPPVRMPADRIDEQATAEQAAEAGLLLPVLRATARREARLRLLMDASSSTAVWDGLLDELRQIAAGLGAFREVSVRYVHEGAGARLVTSLSRDPAAGAVRAAEQLRDPTGRQLTLVLSDCAGPLWRSGAMQELLHHWALAAPVAVVQPLPQRLWRRTHLPPRPGTLRRLEGLGARLDFRAVEGPSREDALPVPVLAPTRTALGTWARLLSGGTGLSLPAAAAWVHADHPAAPPRLARSSAGTGAELVGAFRRTASRQAVSLAVSLSAVPLTLPVMQLVQRATQPRSGPSVLAETLLSGLIVRAEEEGWYTFAPGVREELLRLLPRGEALLLLRHCGEYVERRFGRQVRNFPALALAELTGDGAPSEAEGEEGPLPDAFAEVSALVLGRFRAKTAAQTGTRTAAQTVTRTTAQPVTETVAPVPPPSVREGFRILHRGVAGRRWAPWIAHVLTSCGHHATTLECTTDEQLGVAAREAGPWERVIVLMGGELRSKGAVPNGSVRVWVAKPPLWTRLGRDLPLFGAEDETAARQLLLTGLGVPHETYTPSGSAPEFPGPRPSPPRERLAVEPRRTGTDPRARGGEFLVVHAGHQRAWAAWLAQTVERYGRRAVLRRWDSPRDIPLEDAFRDLLLSDAQVLLVLDESFFDRGPRPEGEWDRVLRGLVAEHAERFAAVTLIRRPLPPATAVLEPVSLWGLSEADAEERLRRRLGLDRPSVSRRRPSLVRYPATPGEVWGEVPRRNPRFTGRDALLGEVHQRLSDRRRAAPCTLVGMPGIGKTQLAVEYAHRFGPEYDLVWWVDSENTGLLRDRLGEVAAHLGVRVGGGGPGERVSAVLEALRRGEPYADWLVIFDGCDDAEAVQALLPHGPGHVLVTSRTRGWGRYTDLLEVPPFQRAESVAHLMRGAPHITADQANDIAALFDDVPLPVAHAASWLGESGMEASEYLRTVREGGLPASADPATGEPFETSSLTSWSILLNRLRRTQPQALDLLSLCVSFAPGRIPLGLVRECPPDVLPRELRWMVTDRPAWERALQTLIDYSVVTRESPEHEESVTMPRLVHDIVSRLADGYSLDATHRPAVRALLTHADPGSPQDSRSWPRYADLLPHLEPSGILGGDRSGDRETALNCLNYCRSSGKYDSGLELAARIRDHWSRTMDPLDRFMLALTIEESALLRLTGRFQEAYDRTRRVLKRIPATASRNPLSEVGVKGEMAKSMHHLGRYQAAYDVHREVLESAELLLGPDARGTLAARHEAAAGLRLLGRYNEARELDLETLRRRERVLRPRHIDTLGSGNALSHDLRLLGDYREALARQEPLVRLHQQVLGPRHPQTLAALGELLLCRRREGGEAGQVGGTMAALVDELARVHGREHHRTLAGITLYANYLRVYGDLGQARDLVGEAETGYRALLGPAHPVAAGMLSNVGLVMRVVGATAEALSMFEEALAGLTSALGPDHPWVLGCALNTTGGRNLAGRVTEAVELGRDTLYRARSTVGESHPLTLSCMAALAADLRSAREQTEATKLEEAAVAGLTRTLGARHSHTVSVRERMRPYWDFEPDLG